MWREQRVHFYYVGPHYTAARLCKPMEGYGFRLPGKKLRCSMDPSQVTCEACQHKMQKLVKKPMP